MCLICVEFQQGKLTIAEARRNLGEMLEKIGQEHADWLGKIIDWNEAHKDDVYEPWVKRTLQGYDRLGKTIEKDDSK